MGRIGKIARLPHSIRAMLNPRIEDGEPGCKLVKWLNSLEVVQSALDEYFGGRPISEQNLSEWKAHGYQAWLRHQESRASIRELLAEAEELEEEVGDIPLTDRLTDMVALTLAQLLREAMNEEKGPRQRAAVLEIVREFARLRRGDHKMEMVAVARERREAEQEEAERMEQEELENKLKFGKMKAQAFSDIFWEKYKKARDKGTLTADQQEAMEGLFAKGPEYFPGFAKQMAAAGEQTKSG